MIRRYLYTSVLFAFCFLNLRVGAETYLITDTNDTTKITSLRGAIIAANHKGGQNIIFLGQIFNRDHARPMVYRLTIPGADETNAYTGDLNVTRGELKIIGVSPNITIDATGLGDRVFQVSSNAHLTLKNLIITGGTAAGTNNGSSGQGESGGAIYNAGILDVENCFLIGNASGNGTSFSEFGGNGGDGAAVYNIGQATINRCTVTENVCGTGSVNFIYGGLRNGGNGGGVCNSGEMTMSMCVVSNNFGGQGPNGVAISGTKDPGGDGGNGGGIYNDGHLDLDFCVINDNHGGTGGAIFFFDNNGSGGSGGGIYNNGKMILTMCAVDNNLAGQGGSATSATEAGGAGGNGGGICNVGQGAVSFSTIYNNFSGSGGTGHALFAGGDGGIGGDGGGIFNAGELNLNTSTMSGNLCGNGADGGNNSYFGGGNGGSGGNGGGIFNQGNLDLISVTITLNICGGGGNGGTGYPFYTVPGGSGGSGGNGGGILNVADTNAVIVRNTLIAQNLANAGGSPGTNFEYLPIPPAPPAPAPVFLFIGNPGVDGIGFDVAGDFTSQGFNLISTGDGSTGFVNGIHVDKVGTDASPIDPLLGPLQMNGGFTPTHALLWGSPAIDQGNCFNVHTDQRGHYRPYIYTSIPRPHGGDGSDIGAFELDARFR